MVLATGRYSWFIVQRKDPQTKSLESFDPAMTIDWISDAGGRRVPLSAKPVDHTQLKHKPCRQPFQKPLGSNQVKKLDPGYSSSVSGMSIGPSEDSFMPGESFLDAEVIGLRIDRSAHRQCPKEKKPDITYAHPANSHS